MSKSQWPKLALVLLMAVFSRSSPALANQPLHIMIDPGHGGSDIGASRGNLKESEIALKVALQLADILKSDPRFKVSLTRTNDHKVPLAKRVTLAEQAKADLFMSIHLNSSTDSRAHGTEIYFQNQLPADEETLYLLGLENEGTENGGIPPKKDEPISAKTDLKRILEDLHRNHRIQVSGELSKTLLDTLIAKAGGQKFGSRAIRQAPFHVVSYIAIPSVLVELGFITHPQEGPRLASQAYQKSLATSIAEGLQHFKDAVDAESSLASPVANVKNEPVTR